MKYQTRLLALLLALCTIFALCGCNAQAEEADAPTQKSSAPAPSAGSEPATDGEAETTEAKIEMLEVVVKESDFAGEWVAVSGKSGNQTRTKEDGLDITLQLGTDLTGTYTESGKSAPFFWYYTFTSSLPNDLNTFYMNFEGAIDFDTSLPSGITFDFFYFDINTADLETLYLTIGSWVYTCKKS